MSDVDEDTADDSPHFVRKRTPYNKGACRQCGVAKTKCIPIPGLKRCERCEKLDRECTPRAPAQRKRRSAPATTARVANLEQKLDSIVNLLSTNQKDSSAEQITPSAQTASSVERDHTSPEVPSPLAVSSNGHDVHASVTLGPKNGAGSCTRGPIPMHEATPFRDSLTTGSHFHSSAGTSLPRKIEFAEGEVDNLLRLYQQCCVMYFPFVAIPAGTSFSQAHKKAPFLFDVISFITSAKDFKRQVALGEKLLEDVVNRLVLRPEKTEELLSGMLLFTNWNHIMFPINGQMTTLMHMMKSLIVNLQYDRPPGSVNRRLLYMKGYANSQIRQMSLDATPRSPGEQRALLGCYYLISLKCMISGSVSMDSFEYNPYLESCANSLEEAKEQPSDVALAYMVRLQRIVDKVNKYLPRGDNPGAVSVEATVPTYMAMKVMQTELGENRATWPDQVKNNTTLNLQHYAGEVFLYETVMIESLKQSSTMDRLQTLEMLNNCLISIQSYLSLYRTIPQSHYAFLPFTIWIQCGLVLQAACELAFFDHTGWDLNYVRATMDLPSFIDWEMGGIQATASMRGTANDGVDGRDIIQRFLRRKQHMKSAYEQRLNAEQQSDPSQGQGQGQSQNQSQSQNWQSMGSSALPSMEDIYMGSLYYDFDNAFWQDFGIGPGSWAMGATANQFPG